MSNGVAVGVKMFMFGFCFLEGCVRVFTFQTHCPMWLRCDTV